MDYETKILLNNLIDAISNPDWWMFGATIISILISGFLSYLLWRTTKKLGKYQNLLQAQQIYLPLYHNLSKLHSFVCSSFLQSICEIMSLANDNEACDAAFEKLNVEYREHKESIGNDLITIKLLLGNRGNIPDLIRMLLYDMEVILMVIRNLIIQHRIGSLAIDAESCLHVSFDEDGPLDVLCESLVDFPECAMSLKELLEGYLKRKNIIFHNKDSVLIQIEKLCGTPRRLNFQLWFCNRFRFSSIVGRNRKRIRKK